MSSWARADSDSKLGAALAELQKLHLLAQVAQGGQAAWAVNASFQAQLRHAICSGCAPGAAVLDTLPNSQETTVVWDVVRSGRL